MQQAARLAIQPQKKELFIHKFLLPSAYLALAWPVPNCTGAVRTGLGLGLEMDWSIVTMISRL